MKHSQADFIPADRHTRGNRLHLCIDHARRWDVGQLASVQRDRRPANHAPQHCAMRKRNAVTKQFGTQPRAQHRKNLSSADRRCDGDVLIGPDIPEENAVPAAEPPTHIRTLWHDPDSVRANRHTTAEPSCHNDSVQRISRSETSRGFAQPQVNRPLDPAIRDTQRYRGILKLQLTTHTDQRTIVTDITHQTTSCPNGCRRISIRRGQRRAKVPHSHGLRRDRRQTVESHLRSRPLRTRGSTSKPPAPRRQPDQSLPSSNRQ